MFYLVHVTSRMKESCWILFCVPMSLIVLRTKIRALLRIDVNKIFSLIKNYPNFLIFFLCEQGSICTDCIKGVFCPLCNVIQLSRELRVRNI